MFTIKIGVTPPEEFLNVSKFRGIYEEARKLKLGEWMSIENLTDKELNGAKGAFYSGKKGKGSVAMRNYIQTLGAQGQRFLTRVETKEDGRRILWISVIEK